MVSKNTICLWYDGTALEAARFYAEIFPDSSVGTVFSAPGDYPAGKQEDALTAALADPDRALRKRVFDAMMTMRKIDIAAIEAARLG